MRPMKIPGLDGKSVLVDVGDRSRGDQDGGRLWKRLLKAHPTFRFRPVERISETLVIPYIRLFVEHHRFTLHYHHHR